MRALARLGEQAWEDLPRRLNPLDTLMWRCERDPRLRSGLVLLLLLDRPPEHMRFAAGHEWATRMIPRLRERPVAPLLAPNMPVWEPDPEFDVARHMRRVRLARPAGRRELLDLAEDLAATPFAANRPPWESVLVEGLRWKPEPEKPEPERYRAAWLVKFHHVLADGPLLASWLSALLSRSREPRSDKPQPAAPALWLDRLPDRLLGPLPAEAGPAARRIALSALRTARTPLRSTAEIGRAARTLADATTRSVGKPSPLLRARGTTRRFELVPVDLDGLRAAARAADVSVNAALCAGLLTGIRHYHEAHGVTAPSLPSAMTVPVVRTGPRTGNRFNGVKFAGPLAERGELGELGAPSEKDATALCRTVQARLDAATPPFPPSALGTVLTCVNQLPTPVLTRLAVSLGRSYDLQVSHVVAPGRDTYVSGARIEQAYCFGPTPGCAITALMLSRRGLGALALTVDAAAVPDPQTLARCIESGFADLSKSPTKSPLKKTSTSSSADRTGSSGGAPWRSPESDRSRRASGRSRAYGS